MKGYDSLITFAEFGPFHGSHAALRAQKEGLLNLYASGHRLDPAFDPNLVFDQSRSPLALSRKILSVAGRLTGARWPTDISAQMLTVEKRNFDHFVAKSLNDQTNIFHAYSSGLTESLRASKIRGIPSFIDFGLAHPSLLNELLKTEYEENGLEYIENDINAADDELHLASQILVPSEFVKRSFLENGFSAEKVYLNPYGVSQEWLFPPARRVRSDGKLVAAFAGGISLRKGIRYLLEAAQKLSERRVPFKLQLYGNWERNLQTVFERYAALVDFSGPATASVLRASLDQADIFVLPSLAEGMSRAVLEAMARGVVPVVSENTGFNEIIRDGVQGFIVPIRNSEIIAQKIEFLFENPGKLREMSLAARKLAETLTWDAYWERLKLIYEL